MFAVSGSADQLPRVIHLNSPTTLSVRLGIPSDLVKEKGWIITVINPHKMPTPILIVYHGGRFYGMDAVCAHFGCGLLTDVKGTVATCPLHGASYDVKTGERIKAPSSNPNSPCGFCQHSLPLKTYKVTDSEGYVDVEFSPD